MTILYPKQEFSDTGNTALLSLVITQYSYNNEITYGGFSALPAFYMVKPLGR